MKKAKCTNCGANIEVEENKEAGICHYCGCAYIAEKAIEKYEASVSNLSTNNANTIVNNYYNMPAYNNEKRIQYVPPRPKINVGLAVLLCFFYFFPGIIYIGVIRGKQEKWDEQYGDK